MTDEQRRAIRLIMSGQEEQPVTLQTDAEIEAGHEPGDGPRRVTVSAEDVVAELVGHDPVLAELLASRVALRLLTEG